MLARMLLAMAAVVSLTTAANAADVSPCVGVRAGVLLFDQTLEVGNRKFVDQGGDALRGDAFACVDFAVSRGLFLGGEVAFGGTSGRSRLATAGVTYSYSIPMYAETALRAGWRSPGGSLLFVRGGAMNAQVNENGARSWRTGPLAGVGLEVPVAGRWGVRLDTSWSQVEGVELWSFSGGVAFRW